MAAGPRFASLADWLRWQQSLHPQAIDLGLERAARVLARTGWRPPACPVIAVGGTNGGRRRRWVRPGSKVVMLGTANPARAGSIPAPASIAPDGREWIYTESDYSPVAQR